MLEPKKRHNHKLLLAATALLLLLVTCIVTVGYFIDRAANQMSSHIVSQIGDSHFRLLDNEFNRDNRHFALLKSYLQNSHPVTSHEMEMLEEGIMQADTTIEGIFFDELPSADTLSRYWTTTDSVVTPAGKRHHIYIMHPLARLHAYLSEIEPLRRSYAVVFDATGRIVYHPDLEEVGRHIDLPRKLLADNRISKDFEREIALPIEDYLGVEQDHIFYPMTVAGERWTAMIGIPTLTVQQEIEQFHTYTIAIAFLSVVLFALLLLYTQRRWKREYELRRQSQNESHRMQLQRIMDRIDPHFLFNSLNSLYVLIRTDARLAREFTLSLSKVYRHVLEHREQSLSTLADELELCREYYKLQKIRFGGNVTLTVDIDEELMEHLLPAMTLQTLVENAVKHNSITPSTPLYIRIWCDNHHITIENNLSPRDEEDNSLGVGLESIRSIYRFYTDRPVEIECNAQKFVCRLPLF